MNYFQSKNILLLAAGGFYHRRKACTYNIDINVLQN